MENYLMLEAFCGVSANTSQIILIFKHSISQGALLRLHQPMSPESSLKHAMGDGIRLSASIKIRPHLKLGQHLYVYLNVPNPKDY